MTEIPVPVRLTEAGHPPMRSDRSGRNFLLAVNADTGHSTRRVLNGGSSRRQTQHCDPERRFGRLKMPQQPQVAGSRGLHISV